MQKFLITGVLALGMLTGVATRQTTTSQTTTTVTPTDPPPLTIAPPTGTLSTTRTQKIVSPDGTVIRSDETTYRNSHGVADDRVTRTTTYPPAAVTTTTKSTSTETR
jgi:hypothetical protein